MKLLPITATKETIDMKRGGLVIYETNVDVPDTGLLVLENPNGDLGVSIVNELHTGGPVQVMVRPIGAKVKKPDVGQVIAQLLVF